MKLSAGCACATVSERDAVLRERAAFVAGYVRPNYCECDTQDGCFLCRDAGGAIARAEYPLPRVTRPRTLVDTDGMQWRVIAGRLHYKHETHVNWIPSPAYQSREFLLRMAELLANPTEEVEAVEADA